MMKNNLWFFLNHLLVSHTLMGAYVLVGWGTRIWWIVWMWNTHITYMFSVFVQRFVDQGFPDFLIQNCKIRYLTYHWMNCTNKSRELNRYHQSPKSFWEVSLDMPPKTFQTHTGCSESWNLVFLISRLAWWQFTMMT